MLRCDGDEARHIEVGRWPGRIQRHRFVGVAHMRRVGVIVRIHGQTRYAKVAHGTHQSQRDFTPVCNQNFFEHQGCSFNKRRNTLPAPVAGSASMKRTSRGAL